MSILSPYLEQLRAEYDLGSKQGFVETHLEGVRFFWGDKQVERASMIYPSGIVIIGQGRKKGYFDEHVFEYGEDTFLVVSVSTPFECTTFASNNEPLLGIFIDVDISDLHELVALISTKDIPNSFEDVSTPGVYPMKVDEDMGKAVERLMMSLACEAESQILGKALVKEIIYRVLVSKNGSSLYSLTQLNTPQTRVAKVIEYIRRNYKDQLTVQMLAERASMSATAFHRAFRKMTGNSPLQYVKKLRLSRARSMIVHDGIKANVAANAVGYDSPSQFSREFKSYFNVTPTKAKNVGYADIDVWQK